MKRRIFLAAAGTVGLAGAVSSASLVSSTYSSISTSMLLEEFSTTSKNVLNKFKADVTKNIQAHGLDNKLASMIANPVQIISKEGKGDNQKIVYKNKSGQFISLAVSEGVETIEVLHTL